VFVLCCVTSDLCDELITRPESPVGFACPIVRDLAALTLRRLMSRMGAPHIYMCGAPILDVSRSYTTTQHSR